MQFKLFIFAASAGIAALTVYLLVSGRNILIPVAIAIMAWYLINAIARGIGRLNIRGIHPPRWVALTLTVVAFIVAIVALTEMVSGSFTQVVEAAPTYQTNLQRLITEGAQLLGFQDAPSITQLVERIDFRSVVGQLAGTLTSIAGDAGIILVYVLFLFVEQGSFNRKIKALFPDREREEKVRKILSHMTREIQSYLWIKTFSSFLTAGISYAVLLGVGVDFAGFWAVIIFLLNYIPTIGSLLGIVFPALLALVQFESFVPFLIVTPCLAIVQVVMGNILEPMMMGSSLNISPFATLVSLAVWGSIWGIPGMFLCVPITVIAMIVFAHFARTRPIAIMLSTNGRVVWGETAARPPP
jgi:predicted PurR-regulated permease PerM